ncbi:putative transcription regulator SWI/SNF-BAF60b family [Helianthus annuus]|nr:putative transcription regulator SWI/SNF-BAF60b family [Helianthus annuus]KAJ0955834.1 putative transcription regulator SWI/SNF-BAF60b family [Helianthus annuus]
MVSDQEIAKGVEILLTQSDHKSFTSLNDVVHHLGEKLGFDLSHKSIFIRDQINRFLFPSQPQPQPPYHHHPPPPQSSAVGKDHFALQQQQQHVQFRYTTPQAHVSQFQHPHFVIHQQQQQQQQQHQQQRQRHPVEVSFKPATAPSQAVVSQSLQVPEVKVEGGGVGGQDSGAKAVEKAKKGGSTGTKRRGGPGGLNKLCGITPELQVIVGESALSRTDIVKQLWAYIKKNNLQDPGNKRKIICDDALRVVFETDCTDMFKMNKLLAKHIIRLEPTKESSRKRSKVDAEPAAESTDDVPSQVIISDALANCLGIGEREMSQSEALRLVWEYIKVNNLEDPQNSVMILCDEKLKELFGCESISAMGIPELVIRNHLTKQ